MEKILMKGNHALAEAAIRAGCRLFFGYPITPASEIAEYMAARLPEVKGRYLQAESEVSAINMVKGAAGLGARVMTASSSPGISLMQECISYMCGEELPCVIVNVMRGSPGLGNIAPSQADYFQATRGGGHGDYYTPVLAPNSVQEMADLIANAFDLAEKYRNPVMILADGSLGQMTEPVALPEMLEVKRFQLYPKKYINPQDEKTHVSIYLEPHDQEKHVINLKNKYNEIRENEVRFEEYKIDDAEIVCVAFGIVSRILESTVDLAREEGIKVGLLRPITLFPFPDKKIKSLADKVDKFLAVELSLGQMVEDVKMAAINSKGNAKDVYFYGRQGGAVPAEKEILEKIREIKNGKNL